MGFNGDYGVYHSAYDSFYWMDRFGDPGFHYHVAAAQLWGTLAMRLAKINEALVQAERQFIDARGLRGRAWYKHQIYAPGFYTGYAAQPLTDFRQAIDDRNSASAKESLERIVEAVKRVTKTLKAAD
jgi:hypothetical protein